MSDVVYTTKNKTYRVRKVKAGYVLEGLAHTGKAVRWLATNAKPVASLAKAKKAARFWAGC